jgi:hypothetical protein
VFISIDPLIAKKTPKATKLPHLIASKPIDIA